MQRTPRRCCARATGTSWRPLPRTVPQRSMPRSLPRRLSAALTRGTTPPASGAWHARGAVARRVQAPAAGSCYNCRRHTQLHAAACRERLAGLPAHRRLAEEERCARGARGARGAAWQLLLSAPYAWLFPRRRPSHCGNLLCTPPSAGEKKLRGMLTMTDEWRCTEARTVLVRPRAACAASASVIARRWGLCVCAPPPHRRQLLPPHPNAHASCHSCPPAARGSQTPPLTNATVG